MKGDVDLNGNRTYGIQKQEILIKMRKCAISVRTQILLSLHNVKPKTSVL